MLGSRSIQLDGWRAHVGAPNWPSGEPTTAEYMDNAPWMLFNLTRTFPKRSIWRPRTRQARQLKQLWFMQASKYKVFPVDSSSVLRLATPRPQMWAPRTKVRFTIPAPAKWTAPMRGCPQSLALDRGGCRNRQGRRTGILLANGGTFAGYTFFINKDQKLQYSHNYVAINEYKVISKEKVPTGKVTLRMEFKKTGPPDFKVGKGGARHRHAVFQ